MRQRLAGAGFTTVLLIAALTTGCAGGFALRHAAASSTRTTPTPSPSAGPNPTYILETDLVDATHGWALLSNCNAANPEPCGYSVSSTADGGQTWAAAVGVGPQFESDSGDAPRHIHFFNTERGYVWGHVMAFSTSDGGKTWSSAALTSPAFVAFAGRGNVAWAVTFPCAKNTTPPAGDCVYRVSVSHDAGRTWSTRALPADLAAFDVVAFEPAGLLISGAAGHEALMTTDGGATWRAIRAACSLETFVEVNSTSDGQALFKVCEAVPADSTTVKALWTSSNAGRTWTRRGDAGPFRPACDSPVTLAPTGAYGTLAVATQRCSIAITRDGGSTWRVVGPADDAFMSVEFADPRHGWALDVHGWIWATHDGGDTWVAIRSPNELPSPTPASAARTNA